MGTFIEKASEEIKRLGMLCHVTEIGLLREAIELEQRKGAPYSYADQLERLLDRASRGEPVQWRGVWINGPGPVSASEGPPSVDSSKNDSPARKPGGKGDSAGRVRSAQKEGGGTNKRTGQRPRGRGRIKES